MSQNCIEIYVHVYIPQVMKSQLINYKNRVRVRVVMTHVRVQCTCKRTLLNFNLSTISIYSFKTNKGLLFI